MSTERLVHIRRTHRIAVLGESEVGKSTLAERLAQLITDREQLVPSEKELEGARFATESQAGILDTTEVARTEVIYDNDSTDGEGAEMQTEAVTRLYPQCMDDSEKQEEKEGAREESTKRGKRPPKAAKRGERKREAVEIHRELYMTTARHAVREHTTSRKVHMREAIVEVVDPIEEGRLARHTALNPDAAVILFDSDDEDAPGKTENWIHTARGLGAQRVFVVRKRHRKNPKAIWKHKTGRELREKRRKLRRERRDKFRDRIAKEVFRRAKKMDAEQATEEAVAKQCIVVAKKAAFKQVHNSCLLL